MLFILLKKLNVGKKLIYKKRESNGNYLFIARIEIDSNKKENYNFVRQR